MFNYRLQLSFRILAVAFLCMLSFLSLVGAEEIKLRDPNLLLRIYLKYCHKDINELKNILARRNIKMEGTSLLASRSEIFEKYRCEDDVVTSTFRDLNFFAKNEKYIQEHGAKSYADGYRAKLSERRMQFNYEPFMNRILNDINLTQVTIRDLSILILLTMMNSEIEALIFYFTNR